MQRKTRILLRAARFLEFEAQEYIEAAKMEDSGYAHTVASEEAASKREVLFFGTLARHYA